MNPLSVDIRQLLVDNDVGSETPTDDWAVQVGRFEDKPDELLCVADIPAPAPMYLFGKETVHEDTCRIVVRSWGYLTGYSKCMEAIEVVAMTSEREINGTDYWSMRQDTSVSYLDKDATGRHLFVFTITAQRQNKGD
jgi:hypothetical protein